MSEQTFNQFVDAVEENFDAKVVTGTDHELFISSYLSGHFSVVVANALNASNYCLQSLDSAMQQSLDKAFRNRELEQQDQQQVFELWRTMISDYSA